jgi:hypothetical protein
MKFTELPFFHRVRWDPDRGELRNFAIAMLIGFGILGLLTILRHKDLTQGTLVLWTIGFVLAISAIIPGLGRMAYLAVYLPSSFVGYFVSRIMLFFVFFLVFVPLGAILKLLGKDLLRLHPKGPRAIWQTINATKDSNRYYRQF